MNGVTGIVAGTTIALIVPVQVLGLGSHLHAAVQTTIILIALMGGVVLALVAAFFGAVMSSDVTQGYAKWGDPEQIARIMELAKDLQADKHRRGEEADHAADASADAAEGNSSKHASGDDTVNLQG